jgi:hypothetical protein
MGTFPRPLPFFDKLDSCCYAVKIVLASMNGFMIIETLTPGSFVMTVRAGNVTSGLIGEAERSDPAQDHPEDYQNGEGHGPGGVWI